MRMPRIKAKAGCDGLYHCMSRIVGGAFLLGSKEKEAFVERMWRLADFLDIEVLDYVVMSNHYHQLLRAAGVVRVSNKQLLAKLKLYYGAGSRQVRDFESALARGKKDAKVLRRKYLRRIGDISEFEKILKQGYSSWYNRRHKRRGTLWMERFKSVLVEDTLDVRSIIAAYIDLNPVRAEMVEDPKNYLFCGYGAAMGGDLRCRKGIMAVMGMTDWEEASAQYRLHLIERGHVEVAGKKGKVSRDLLLETLKQNGQLPRSELLRLRVRYFSDGLVLGTEAFVEDVFEQFHSHFGEKRKSGARALRGYSGSGLKVIRDLRIDPIS
jgi:putative transposase